MARPDGHTPTIAGRTDAWPRAASSLSTRRAAATVLLGLIAATPTQAAGRPRSGIEAAHVDSFEAKLDLLSRVDFERYQVFALDAVPREATKLLFGQRLGARGTGSFVHPRFWQWSLSINVLLIEDLLRGQLAAVQPNLEAPAFASADRYRVDAEYDARWTFLGTHPYPITLFATRGTQLVERVFQSNYWLTTSTYGGSAAWHNDLFPLSLQYSFQRNDGEQREVSSSDEVHELQIGGQRDGTRATARFDYRMTDYHNRVFTGVDYLIHRLDFDHEYKLTEDGVWLLSTRLRGQRRETDQNTFSEARLLEGLQLTPDRTLRLRALYELAWWRLDAEDVLENVGWIEARHQLYKSLTTTLHARITHDLGTSGDRLDGAVGGSVLYRKQLGPKLVMLHTYQALAGWTRYSSDLAEARVIDEPVTLVGEIPVRLALAGVDIDTVEVIDATGTIRYLRGRDFDLFTSGEETMIRRLLGGNIPEGATVLVSYTHATSGVAAGRSIEHRYTGRLETTAWDWIKLYGEYGYQDLGRRSSTISDNLSAHELRTGVEVTEWNAHATAEYHFYATERFTAHELAISSSFMLPLAASFEPVFGVRENYVDISALGEHKNAFQVFTEAQFPLGDTLSASWRANFTWELGGANDGLFLNGISRLTWHWRKLTLWVEYEVRLAQKEYEAYGRHSVSLNFRREL